MRVLESVQNKENKDLNGGLFLVFVPKASKAVVYKYNEDSCPAVVE